jgi:ribosome-associated protein
MTPPNAATVEIPASVRAAVTAIDDRQGQDLLVLDLDEISEFTEFFLICTGASERQVRGIADGVRDQLREQGSKPLHVEGEQHGQWVLMDYGDFLVHIFSEPMRDYYRLESLWADAPDVTEQFR